MICHTSLSIYATAHSNLEPRVGVEANQDMFGELQNLYWEQELTLIKLLRYKQRPDEAGSEMFFQEFSLRVNHPSFQFFLPGF